jgi:hypothetical protein
MAGAHTCCSDCSRFVIRLVLFESSAMPLADLVEDCLLNEKKPSRSLPNWRARDKLLPVVEDDLPFESLGECGSSCFKSTFMLG